MTVGFEGWQAVAKRLTAMAAQPGDHFNEGQRATLRAIADRLPDNGVVLADEVGMGKTRVAVGVARAVSEAGGRAAILVPPGLGYQWSDDLRSGEVRDVPPVLRSLWSFLSAWDCAGPPPWFKRPVVLVSHAFANWRLGENSEAWRWELLPWLYAEWRRRIGGRLPRGFRDWQQQRGEDPWVAAAARSICMSIPDRQCDWRHRRMSAIYVGTAWPEALEAVGYSRNGHLRQGLEQAVGLGLGAFDFVVVDEAHKARGEDTGLSTLLKSIVLQTTNARRLAVTATPIELDIGQWQSILLRIEVDERSLAATQMPVEDYQKAVTNIRRRWRSDEAIQAYAASARAFERALAPFILRRNKDEEESVREFMARTGKSVDAYRHQSEIGIDIKSISLPWRQAVCATEALSVIVDHGVDPVAKRLRLTLGNGHGIAGLIDHGRHDAAEEPVTAADSLPEPDGPHHAPAGKNAERVTWWRSLAARGFLSGEDALFSHPVIGAAIAAIEEYTSRREKVLVFGRFTQPMRVLTQLLNARAMLRVLDAGGHWPQERLHDDAEWRAVEAASRQLSIPWACSKEEVRARLKKQYGGLEKRRAAFSKAILGQIDEGLSGDHPGERAIFKAARESNGDAMRALVRALAEMFPTEGPHHPKDCAQAFVDLVATLRDRDEDSARAVDAVAEATWSQVAERLQEDYATSQGSFARLMHGETKLTTRRFMQLAFNRLGSNPRVLVAQSLVGREGLNLHKACAVVVLLHPEWNPGVVEQQIGRVDRVGSWWEQRLREAMEKERGPDADLPRIEVRPVIFRGTYDEYNWEVLQERWDNLRAQLHGVVIPAGRHPDRDSHEYRFVRQLEAAAPCFSPSRINQKPD